MASAVIACKRCSYCGLRDHIDSTCSIKLKAKASCGPQLIEERVTRTRSRVKSTLTLEEIMFMNHMVPAPTYKKDVDAYIKATYGHKGMVDDYAVGSLFDNVASCYTDEGHMAVLGYIVAKYCETSHPSVKAFFDRMYNEMGNPRRFRDVLSFYYDVIPKTNKNGMYYSKRVGSFA